ncbi:hypothetical protein PISMIDRAFT_672571 [Pisolithus microcarpus 441]|uniref:Uncharacterized protein n=1 Tax=Pisolithus microcarpus 441 TaxID=765257 RepID=A0A0D0AAX3_9AGAM|nr:hypothetical protein PISMIDRAFT_672571 [Pisolithus microcarpus 441]
MHEPNRNLGERTFGVCARTSGSTSDLSSCTTELMPTPGGSFSFTSVFWSLQDYQ